MDRPLWKLRTSNVIFTAFTNIINTYFLPSSSDPSNIHFSPINFLQNYLVFLLLFQWYFPRNHTNFLLLIVGKQSRYFVSFVLLLTKILQWKLTLLHHDSLTTLMYISRIYVLPFRPCFSRNHFTLLHFPTDRSTVRSQSHFFLTKFFSAEPKSTHNVLSRLVKTSDRSRVNKRARASSPR